MSDDDDPIQMADFMIEEIIKIIQRLSPQDAEAMLRDIKKWLDNRLLFMGQE